MVTSQWVKDSVGWCYVGANGYMVYNQWVKDSTGWCYVGANGYMVYNQWVKDSKGWCYVGANGYMVTNDWAKDSVGWCYLDANGYMVTNQWKKDSKGWCWLGADGHMATNAWVKDSKGWCYVGADGYCVTNTWKQDSKGWCYLDSEGSMVKNDWVLDGGKWYYLDGNGYMVTGWKKIGSYEYYFYTNGSMAVDTWIGEYYVNSEGKYVPSAAQNVTLTIGLPLYANVDDYDTNAYTLWLEEQTGYDLHFITFQPNSADYKAQLSTMMVMGDKLPDILWNFNLGKGAFEEYGKSGYFIDLAPYYNDEKLSANFWAQMDKLKALDAEYHDYILRALTADDGGMYALARIDYDSLDTMNYQTYINQDWLDALGLDMPTNTDELYDVLVAFRDKDPNGNGKKDELPLVGGPQVVQWIINMFLYHDPNSSFNVDENNQLYLTAATDEYRQALIYIRKLIDEGLMFNSAFSFGNKDIKSLLNPPQGEALTVGIAIGHPTLIFEVDNPSVYSYEALPYWGNAIRGSQLFTPATFITEDCENPEAAWKLLMTMYSQEGALRQRYGAYGVDYVDADPGSTNFLGEPATIKVLNESAFTGQNNCSWHAIQCTALIQCGNELCQLSEDMGKWVSHKMKIMGDCYNNYVAAEQNNHPESKYILPDLVIPDEVAYADANERSNCNSLISEALSSFCRGFGIYNDPSSDQQWAAYIAELESLGYKTWMKNRQLVYEDQFPERIPTN